MSHYLLFPVFSFQQAFYQEIFRSNNIHLFGKEVHMTNDDENSMLCDCLVDDVLIAYGSMIRQMLTVPLVRAVDFWDNTYYYDMDDYDGPKQGLL